MIELFTVAPRCSMTSINLLNYLGSGSMMFFARPYHFLIVAIVGLLSSPAPASSEGVAKQGLAAGCYSLKLAFDGSACMDISGGSPANGSVVPSWSCNASAARSRSVAPVSTPSGKTYQLVSSLSGSCLDFSALSVDDGGQMQARQRLNSNQPNQLWQIYPYGNDTSSSL
ncbi:RICIN domain-containing protein [Granulicella tundricola]|uniref:RICIN domain-containing protein n=1 Tax=Granulicella tundricola TaxID=940615 RepID=UPI000A037C02